MLTCAITALAGPSQHWQAYHSTGRPITALACPSQHWQAYHSTGRPITAPAGLSQHWQAYHSTGRPITALAGLSQYIPHTMGIRIISLYIPFLAAANNSSQKQTSAVELYIYSNIHRRTRSTGGDIAYCTNKRNIVT